jgi:hypothetical protein
MTTWNQVTSLNAQQQAKMEQFRLIGIALESNPAPDISMVNDNQAKYAAQFLNQDLYILIRATEAGVRYVRDFYRGQVVKNYEDGVVAGA